MTPGHDCNDKDASIFPGAAEVCDGKDNDCDGQVDEGAKNACGVCGPTPMEVCDGIDLDCDGLAEAMAATDASRAALRAWLPPPAELLRIAENECAWRAHACAVHPALLCARLHGEWLGAWAAAAEVAEGVLATEAFNPVVRTEALRLLGRARAAIMNWDSSGAGAALRRWQTAARDESYRRCCDRTAAVAGRGEGEGKQEGFEILVTLAPYCMPTV